MAEHATFEMTSYPPKLFNASWYTWREDARREAGAEQLAYAKHLADGPCIVYMLSLAPAHNGPARHGFCWMYNAFSELQLEADFWIVSGPRDFAQEHVEANQRLAQYVEDDLGAVWIALRGDLSHRAEIPAEEFAKVRFIAVDEVRLVAGRLAEFETYRRDLADAYSAAGIEQPAWVYEVYCGGPTRGFQIWTPYQEMAEFDRVHELRERIDRALGERRGKVADAAAASISESETQLFSVNPGGSYVPSDVLSADPFWNSTERVFP